MYYLLDDTTASKPEVQESQGTVIKKPPIPQKYLTEVAASSQTNQTVHQEISVTRPVAASTTSNESKGFSSVSVPLLNQTLQLPPDMNGSAQERPGIILSRNFETQDRVKPVLSRDDIFQTRQTGFPSGISAGFELPGEKEPAEYENRSFLSENFKFQTENRREPPGFPTYDDGDQHGFSLQPVTGVLQPGEVNVAQILEEAIVEDIFSRNVSGSTHKTGGNPAGNTFPGEVSSDEDTPPPESLKNIKSVVRKRREAQNNTKPPTGKQRETKKGTPKVMPRSATPGGRARKIEDKGGRVGKVRSKQGIVGDDKNVVVDDRFGWKDKTGMSSSREKKGITSRRQKVRK